MDFSEIFRYLLRCSIVIPMVPLCFYPVRRYIKNTVPVLIMKITLALFTAALVVALSGYFIISLPEETNIILFLIGIYSFYLYNEEVELTFSKKLFVFLTACLVGGFSLLIAAIADYTMHPASHYLNFSMEALRVQFLFLAASDIVLYLPLSRDMGWVVENFHEESIWNKVSLFLALFLAALFCIRPRRYSTMYTGKVREVYLILLFFFAFFVILIYFMFYVIARTYVEKQKVETMNHMLSIQGTQYQQLLRTVEEDSRIRHDFRHQLIVIAKLIEQKEYEKLEQYVGKYIEDTQEEVKLYSSSAAINALISYYDSICMRKGIRREFSVSLPEKILIPDQDFCVMLGNLLENAIDGVRGANDPYICLKIRQTASNMLAIKVVNPYQGEFRKERGHYRSSKREGVGRGLESVNTIVQRHQGVMEILTGGQVFTVKALLQIPVCGTEEAY